MIAFALREICCQRFEIFKRCFQVFHDFGGKNIRIGKAVKIGQGLVLEPENIKKPLAKGLLSGKRESDTIPNRLYRRNLLSFYKVIKRSNTALLEPS